jgi:hypothetical protein
VVGLFWLFGVHTSCPEARRRALTLLFGGLSFSYLWVLLKIYNHLKEYSQSSRYSFQFLLFRRKLTIMFLSAVSPLQLLPMLADISRKSAVDSLLLHLDTLRGAISDFHRACQDPRLTAPSPQPPNEENRQQSRFGISFEAMCFEIELQISGFDALLQPFHRGTIALKRIRNHSFTLTPISVLPTELITSVFLLVTQMESGSRSSSHAADAIAQVCHTWREIAVATPRLWRCIGGFYGPIDQLNKRIARWGSRSADCGLDIYLPPSCLGGSGGATRLTPYFDSALKLFPRWRNLTIRDERKPTSWAIGVAERFIYRICALPSQSTLETLELWRVYLDHSITTVLMTTLSRKFPALRELSIRTTTIPTILELPRNLVSLKIAGVFNSNSKDFYNILKSCTQLESIDFNDYNQAYTEDRAIDASKPIKMLHLRHLRLAGVITNQLFQFLEVVQADKLFSLRLEVRHGPRVRDISNFVRFIRHAGASLSKFTLADESGLFWELDAMSDQPHLLSILQHLPHLEQLHIVSTERPIPVEVMRGLTLARDAPTTLLVPILRRLLLHGPVSFTPKTLANLVETRSIIRGLRLDVIDVDCRTEASIDDDANDAIRARLRACAKMVHWKFRQTEILSPI